MQIRLQVNAEFTQCATLRPGQLQCHRFVWPGDAWLRDRGQRREQSVVASCGTLRTSLAESQFLFLIEPRLVEPAMVLTGPLDRSIDRVGVRQTDRMSPLRDTPRRRYRDKEPASHRR